MGERIDKLRSRFSGQELATELQAPETDLFQDQSGESYQAGDDVVYKGTHGLALGILDGKQGESFAVLPVEGNPILVPQFELSQLQLGGSIGLHDREGTNIPVGLRQGGAIKIRRTSGELEDNWRLAAMDGYNGLAVTLDTKAFFNEREANGNPVVQLMSKPISGDKIAELYHENAPGYMMSDAAREAWIKGIDMKASDWKGQLDQLRESEKVQANYPPSFT
jgi:hypothetical protein